MSLPVFWTPEADADAQQAGTWYANLRPELGEYFAAAVAATIEAIADYPNDFPTYVEGQ